MVLTQRGAEKNSGAATLGFHTTMVLTQQALRTLDHTAFSRFHTTMVLTQQPTKQVAFETPFHVSIPLWFLRNFASPVYLRG